MTEHFSGLINWYMEHISYWSIALLMGIESTIIPLPSEVVVPPAIWQALKTGELSIPLIILSATIGALIGSLINYSAAYFLGRPVLHSFAKTKIARTLMVDEKHLTNAEEYFVKNGALSTLIGRLVPGIRHLISLPAGVAKMPLASFMLFTFIGAGVWNCCLAAIGMALYSKRELLEPYYHNLSIAAFILGGLFVAFLIWNGVRPRKASK